MFFIRINIHKYLYHSVLNCLKEILAVSWLGTSRTQKKTKGHTVGVRTQKANFKEIAYSIVHEHFKGIQHSIIHPNQT